MAFDVRRLVEQQGIEVFVVRPDSGWHKIGSLILPPYTDLQTQGLYVMRHATGTVDFEWIATRYGTHSLVVALKYLRGNPLALGDFFPDITALPAMKELYGE